MYGRGPPACGTGVCQQAPGASRWPCCHASLTLVPRSSGVRRRVFAHAPRKLLCHRALCRTACRRMLANSCWCANKPSLAMHAYSARASVMRRQASEAMPAYAGGPPTYAAARPRACSVRRRASACERTFPRRPIAHEPPGYIENTRLRSHAGAMLAHAPTSFRRTPRHAVELCRRAPRGLCPGPESYTAEHAEEPACLRASGARRGMPSSARKPLPTHPGPTQAYAHEPRAYAGDPSHEEACNLQACTLAALPVRREGHAGVPPRASGARRRVFRCIAIFRHTRRLRQTRITVNHRLPISSWECKTKVSATQNECGPQASHLVLGMQNLGLRMSVDQ